MKAWLSAGAAILVAATALAPMARADNGPRASSHNNWPGMSSAAPGMANSDTAAPFPGTAPQYVWQQSYDQDGSLRGHWVQVR